MPEISALIFDFDGVILDTETPEFHIWQDIFAEHGGGEFWQVSPAPEGFRDAVAPRPGPAQAPVRDFAGKAAPALGAVRQL